MAGEANKKIVSFIFIAVGSILSLVTYYAWNYAIFNLPFLYIISGLIITIGIGQLLGGLKIAGIILVLFGLIIAVFGLSGGNLLWILTGVLMLVGGIVLIFNPKK